MLDVPSFADLNLTLALPGIAVALLTTILLIVDVFIQRKIVTAWLTLGILGIGFVLNMAVYTDYDTALGGLFIMDEFTAFLNVTVLITAILSVLLSADYLKRTGMERGEFYSLLLFSVAGIMFMGSANDLIVIFVALELLSIPLYVMSAFKANDLKSEESGIKYFIMGAFASAFFVYGAALVYGATGTTSLPAIVDAVGPIVQGETGSQFYLLLGAALLFVGLGFKVAAVPFHMWSPDVYQGAPTPVTAFMSVGAKIGGFAALLRIMGFAMPAFVLNLGDATESLQAVGDSVMVGSAWQTAVWIVEAVTLIFGNLIAISQTDFKRLLAYSSIAHAGYLLMAVAASGTVEAMLVTNELTGENEIALTAIHSAGAMQAALVYLLAYAFTNLGAFGIALAMEKEDAVGVSIEQFTGLGKSKPLLAAMMAVFMLSLTGIPLTAGFIGKWLVFQSAIEAGLIPLAIIGVLTSVVSAFYYVRIIINMYLKDGDGDPLVGQTNYVTWAVYASFAGVLLLGIFPVLATNLLEPAASLVYAFLP